MGGKGEGRLGHGMRGQSPDSPRDHPGWRTPSAQDILEMWVLWWLACLACLTSQLWTWIDLLYWIHFAPGTHKEWRGLAQCEESCKSPGELRSWGRSEGLVSYSYNVQINRVVGSVLLSVYRLLWISAAICIHAAVNPIQLRRGNCTSWAKESNAKRMVKNKLSLRRKVLH